MRLPDSFIAEVRERSSVVEIAGRLTPLRRAGREYEGRCPFHAEKTPSFTVVEDKGFAHCFGCGWHGGAFKLIEASQNVGFREAVEILAAEAGLTIPGEASPRKRVPIKAKVKRPTISEERADELAAIEEAREIWRTAGPTPFSLAETYLRARGITGELPPTIRCHPKLKYWDAGAKRESEWPCMVAALQAADRSIVGVHRTWIAWDGSAKAAVPKAKKMRGRSWGSSIRLASAAPVLGIAEGIETGLSVMVTTGLPVWVAGSLGNIAGFGLGQGELHPERDDKRLPSETPDLARPGLTLPPEVREVVILADGDGDRYSGPALVERAVRRLMATGRRVRVAWPRPGSDFNDVLRGAA